MWSDLAVPILELQFSHLHNWDDVYVTHFAGWLRGANKDEWKYFIASHHASEQCERCKTN